MKKSLVQTFTAEGNEYGQVSSPADLMNAQKYAHDRTSKLLADFIGSSRSEVKGFAYELGAGNAFDITIKRPGSVYTADGLTYDFISGTDTTLEFEEADDSLPRLDLVVAKIEDETDAEMDLIPFVRLRTTEEFGDDVQPYTPQNVMKPRELHWKATPQLKTGTPAATPAMPTYGTDEIPLYLIAIAPGVTSVGNADVLDLRDPVKTLRQLNTLADETTRGVAQLAARVGLLEHLESRPIDMPQVFGTIRSLGDILSDLNNRIDASSDNPEIRYERLKYPPYDKRTGQIVATGGTATGVPYVNIPFGARVNFGAAEFSIIPRYFADQSVNPRWVTPTGNEATHTTREVDLDLEGVTQIASDGDTDFLQRAAYFTAARSRAACAARNGRYIEVFGGLSGDNASALSDWSTYDTENDTLTPRTPVSTLPAADRPALFSYGDGTNVLLIAAGSGTSSPRAFKINCSTGGVTELTDDLPTGVQFFGDTLTDGKIFIVALRLVSSTYVPDFWEFDTDTDTFTELGVSGSVPAPTLDAAAGCLYAENKFVLASFDPLTIGSGRTYIFDRTTLQWTRLNIAQPYGGTASMQAPLTGFRMANIGGSPTLAGGYLSVDGDASRSTLWTLKTTTGGTAWIKSDATFIPLSQMGFCSLLGGTDLANGRACLFAGRFSPPTGIASTHIYLSSQAGLIAADVNGTEGISIAESSTFVQFELPAYTADFEVAAYFASLAGDYNIENLKLEVSLDDGDNWHTVSLDKTLLITDSDDPGERRLRVTLYQSLVKPPILTKLTEAVNSEGAELEDRIFVRYNSPGTVKALYIDRYGVITLSSTIEPSTPAKAILHKITPDGTNAPTVKNFINRRRGAVTYKMAAINNAITNTCGFDNELAVVPRYVTVFSQKEWDGETFDSQVTYGFRLAELNLDAFDDVTTFLSQADNGDDIFVNLFF